MSAPHTVVFENATLFDGVSRDAPDGMFVLVEGETIREVSDRPIVSATAVRVDCTGRTLMPGLIDTHVHVYAESLQLGYPEPPLSYRAHYAARFLGHALSCGFTSVRDVAGGDHGLAMALKAGFLEGPRFFYGGLALSQTGGHGDFRSPESTDFCNCAAHRNFLAVVADGVDDCVKAVRDELRKGAQHIKIMASGGVLSPSDPLERCQYGDAEIRAIVEECARRGAYVAAHCHPAEAIRRCVALGVRTIEHGTLIDDDTARFVAEHAAYVVPTISVMQALKDDGRAMGVPEVSYQKLLRVYDHALLGLQAMQRHGVKMGFGTDLLGPQHPRRGTEFTLRREVLAPYEILHSATAVNAEILQMQGKLGVVAVNAFADLIVVQGNPLRDIDLLAAGGQHLSHIMLDGRFVKA